MIAVGELRHTSAGNVYRLERIDGERRFVRHIKAAPPFDLLNGVQEWRSFHWEEQLPLVGGDTSEYPHFGVFVP